MRDDAGLHARTPRVGRNSSFFPTSLRAIFRNVSASASNLATTVRSAGTASSVSMVEDEHQREQVQWAGFDRLELGPAGIRQVLLLTYINGFQVWDVEEADDVQELVSKRDGPVAFLQVQPQPFMGASDGALKAARPLLLVVTGDIANCNSTNIPNGLTNGHGGIVGSSPAAGNNSFVPTVVKFYSLRSHTYMHTLRFRTAIYTVRCSSRVVAVALFSQLYCFDAATLQTTFSVLTYPSPQAGISGLNSGYGAVAVGPRWLAYAANQPVISNTGRVSPQHLSPSPGVSPSTSPANGSLVAHYAKESSKQIAAGIVTLGDMGYKTLSRYCSELLPEGAGSPVLGSPSWKNNCNGLVPPPHEAEHAGTVIIRDFVNKTVVAQFRAHRSPLSALCFDPSGILLVTASIHGHSINVFQIFPSVNGANLNAGDANTSYVHLYKLSRGVTDAVIQDIAFSEDSQWIVVSSSRGTNHLFAISPFGGNVGPHTHGTASVDQAIGRIVAMPTFPWWSNMGSVKSTQQPPLPPPQTVHSGVVSRIKNGNAGWRGKMSSAAAAASGRTCNSSGAVAVVFHDGRGQNHNAQVDQNSLKEQLWVLSPSGHLIRYALRPSAGVDGSYCNNASPNVGVGAHCNSKETPCLRVVVEPSQRWDVCRRPNWVEREERMDDSVTLESAQDETNTVGTSRYANRTNMGCFFGRHGKEEMTAGDMHQWFLSNAEVQMHHCKPPIWAKSQISFHVFTGVANDGLSLKDDSGGEREIEKVSTRVVEVRKKDLVPVFDRLKKFQYAEGARGRSLPLHGTLNSPGLHLRSLRDDGIQHGFIGTDFAGIQVQRSSSESSCGSEGSLFSGANAGLNGFHHSYQDASQDLQTDGLTHNLQPCLHQSRQLDKAKLQSGRLSGSGLARDKKLVSSTCVIGSPPMDIPKIGHQDICGVAPGAGAKSGVESHVGLDDLQRIVTLPSNGSGEVPMLKTEDGGDFQYSCEGRIDVNSNRHGSIARNGSFSHSGSAATSIRDQRDAAVVDGTALQSIPQTQCHFDLNHDSGRASSNILHHVGKSDLQDYDATAEDEESTDANSKGDDFDGGEHGEDVLEGAMFSFAEDC